MAGQAGVGQQLTPTQNVTAPAGYGGNKWGANGGDINPVGVDKPVLAAIGNGETATNYETSPIPGTVKGAPTQSVGTQLSTGALSSLSLGTALPSGGSNQG